MTRWQEIEGRKKAGFEWGNCSDGLLSGSSGRVMQNAGEKCEFYLERITIRIKLRDEKRDIYNSSIQLTNLYVQLESAEVQLSECGKEEAQIGEKTILSEKIKKAYEIKGEYARCQDALRNMQTCESALKEQQERAPLLKNSHNLPFRQRRR